ncbi:NUDIX domain-containing protein [Apiospora kogelbergensis]|uniref:NUDIX domain-containing protein n=1 Tax=Apiospora kogelbergensis TaxID=1337665 RepID=A0AAW0QB97_9PEZI
MFSTTAKQQGSAQQLASPVASSSIILLSHTNQVLMQQRSAKSTSFASASVFPGGVWDEFHDGKLPNPYLESYHKDSLAYRLCAIRELFEESGILLARKAGTAGDLTAGDLLVLPAQERDEARKAIYSNKISFTDWLDSVGGEALQKNLQPFTRWVTPAAQRKRFTTQMYIYMLPLSRPSTATNTAEAELQADSVLATPDGTEVSTSAFEDAATWLSQMKSGDIALYPPQAFLLTLISQFCEGLPPNSTTTTSSATDYYQDQRDRLTEFIRRVPTTQKPKSLEDPTSQIPWPEKVISPVNSMITDDGRYLLTLGQPGPELKSTGRGGDFERVVLVRLENRRTQEVQVMDREEAFKVLRPMEQIKKVKL